MYFERHPWFVRQNFQYYQVRCIELFEFIIFIQTISPPCDFNMDTFFVIHAVKIIQLLLDNFASLLSSIQAFGVSRPIDDL